MIDWMLDTGLAASQLGVAVQLYSDELKHLPSILSTRSASGMAEEGTTGPVITAIRLSCNSCNSSLWLPVRQCPETRGSTSNVLVFLWYIIYLTIYVPSSQTMITSQTPWCTSVMCAV